MKTDNRRLMINWNDSHNDLKQHIENDEPYEISAEDDRGWSYITFFPKDVDVHTVLFDVNRLQALAVKNSYYLPHEVISQHNKVVVTAYPDGEEHLSPLFGLYQMISSYADHFLDSQQYPSHGFYGKLGGIYNRPAKGRVIAIYSANDESLLDIYDSLEKLLTETSLKGIRFELRFSNGLSALPRMLFGFDDSDYRHSGAKDYRITDPSLFTVLLNQAKLDYEKYHFDDTSFQI